MKKALFFASCLSLLLAATACNTTTPEAKTTAGAAKTTANAAKTDTAAAGNKATAKTEGKAAPATPATTNSAKPTDGKAAPAGKRHPALMDPSLAKETAPASYKVKFETTKGEFVVEVTRELSPNAADRLYNLVKIGYYNEGIAFVRVIDRFMAQFGIHGDPEVNKVWRKARIPDDPNKMSNTPMTVTFATAGPNTRTVQLFINFGNNNYLDNQFSPFGKIVSGQDAVKKIYKGYGEGAPRGKGPGQGLAQSKGNAYLKESFPKLDYINKASIIE